jgi:hypothetical protein
VEVSEFGRQVRSFFLSQQVHGGRDDEPYQEDVGQEADGNRAEGKDKRREPEE